MQKNFKIIVFILLLLAFGTPNVNAKELDERCGNSDFWDPWYWTADERSFGWNTETDLNDYTGLLARNFVYNIDSLDTNGGDILIIQGWAFTTGTTSRCTNDSVSFKLVPDGGGKEYEFERNMGSYVGWGTNQATQERNYSQWTCVRTPYESKKTAGRCRTGSESHLSGGFKLSLDLGQLKEEKTYTLMMKYNDGPSSGWFKAAIGPEAIQSNVLSYNGNGSMNIKIDGAANKIESVGYNRALGESGTYCDAPGGGTAEQKSRRTITGTLPLAGPGIWRSLTSGQMKLYPTSQGYLPAIGSRLVSDEGLKVRVTKGETMDYEESEPPAACEGGEVYILHYLFLDIPTGKTVDRHTAASRSDDKYGDIYAIKDILQVDSLSELLVGDGKYVSIKDKSGEYGLEWFHTALMRASREGKRYYQVGNTIFIDKEKWVDYDNGGIVQDAPIYDISLDEFTRKSVQANVTITRMENATLNGYVFDVQRVYSETSPTSASEKLLIRPKDKLASTVVTSSSAKLYQPAVYTMSLCKRPPDVPAQCEDDVTPANCSGEDGTHAVFHEHKDVKTCTLEQGTHSGFMLRIEKPSDPKSTTSPEGVEFGKVACREEFDAYLPTEKFTAAGQYYVLDKDDKYEQPHIKGYRLCATSEVVYDDLDNDLKDHYEKPQEVDQTHLEYKYNYYRDQLWIYRRFEDSTIKLSKKEGKGTCTDEDGESHEYDKTDWSIGVGEYPGASYPAKSTPNGTHGYKKVTGTYIKTYPPECGDAPSGSDEDPDKRYKEEKQKARNDTLTAKAAYNAKLKKYHQTVIAYNNVFDWTEPVVNTRIILGGSGLEPADTIEVIPVQPEDTKYKFNPILSFNYADKRDGTAAFKSLPYDYEGELQTNTSSTSYWPENGKPSNDYSDVNGGSPDIQERELMNCAHGNGNSCSEVKVIGQFHHNGAIKREETREYDYNLPQVYTTVPDGRVTSPDPGNPRLELPRNAVPVNINVPAGIYNYEFIIDDLKDEVRSDYYTKRGNNINKDDNWADEDPTWPETRFTKRNVFGNYSDTYTCHYEVINDIYIPVNPERFNFFYRIIDTENVNPNSRTLGYNWSDSRGAKVQELMIRNEESYQRLTNSSDVDKFVFTLTPVIMKEIRKYNALQTYRDDGYADWDLNCFDYDTAGGYHCYSNFLNCLTGGDEEPGQESCSRIFGSSFETAIETEFESKKSNYDKQDLDDNRRILINKQNGIDNRGGAGP